MTDLKGRIALVTGASRGLGYAVGEALARRGAHIVALARTIGGLEELDDAVAGGPGGATLTPLDVTDDEGLARLGAAIHGRWGRLDLLVHCAAEPAPLAPAEHATAKDFDKAMATNATALQRLIRIVDPLLKAAEAAQVVMTADPAAEGAKFNGPYGASKAAARAFALSYAAECARKGPLVWLAAPPPMPTALRARFHPGEDRAGLTPCAAVAEKLVERIVARDSAPGATRGL
ncbi:MAG: SDR family oxidoreductase [Pseudomonadota bacterium]